METSVWVLQITQDCKTDWVTCYVTKALAMESGARYALAQAEDILSRDADTQEFVDELRECIATGDYLAAIVSWNETGSDGTRYVEVHDQDARSAVFFPACEDEACEGCGSRNDCACDDDTAFESRS